MELWSGTAAGPAALAALVEPYRQALGTPAWEALPPPSAAIRAFLAEVTARWPAQQDATCVWSAPPWDQARGDYLRLAVTTSGDQELLAGVDDAMQRHGLVLVAVDGPEVSAQSAPGSAGVMLGGAPDLTPSPFPAEWDDDPLPAGTTPDRVTRVDGPRAAIGGLAARPRWAGRRG